MSRMIETKEPVTGVVFGPTARPEGEEIMRHASTTGEASRKMLAKDSTSTRPRKRDQHAPVAGSSVSINCNICGLGADACTCTKITRATSKIPIEPWRIGAEGHHQKKCGLDCPGCKLYKSLYDAQRACATAMNVMIRAYWRADADALEPLLASKEKITAAAWPMPALNAYALARAVAPDLASGVAASLSRMAYAKWRKTRFDALVRMTMSPPHYRRDLPVPIREQGLRVSHVEGTTYEVSFSLAPGRQPGGYEFKVPIIAHDGWLKEKLQALTSGEWKIGEALLEQDRRHRAKWYIRFTYTRKVPVTTAMKVAGINRGMVCALAAAINGSNERLTYYGEDIIAVLKQIQRRRRSYQNSVNASRRGGHGRDRTLAPLLQLQEAGQRWRATKNQTLARWFAEWCKRNGVGMVGIEDFSGIRDAMPESLIGGKRVWDLIQEWPYYDLGRRIESCLDECGIAHVKVPAPNLTRTCSRCGWCAASDEEVRASVDIARRRFRCQSCGLELHLDVKAARNSAKRAVLAKGDGSMENDGEKSVGRRNGKKKG